jgi:hypothetical protein
MKFNENSFFTKSKLLSTTHYSKIKNNTNVQYRYVKSKPTQKKIDVFLILINLKSSSNLAQIKNYLGDFMVLGLPMPIGIPPLVLLLLVDLLLEVEVLVKT